MSNVKTKVTTASVNVTDGEFTRRPTKQLHTVKSFWKWKGAKTFLFSKLYTLIYRPFQH